MFTHFIYISSDYIKKERIGFHIVADMDKNEEMRHAKEIMKEIRKRIDPSVILGKHVLSLSTDTFESLQDYDHFFTGLVIYPKDDFIKTIESSRKMKGIDVAHYILCLKKVTHLSLQNLTYLCYADYLQKTGEPLFDDVLYAFQYGPIVDSVYTQYKGMTSITFPLATHSLMAHEARIQFCHDGMTKLLSIKETLKKYGDMSATELVNITHSKNSPWSMTDRLQMFAPISDETIKKYHKYETLPST